ncbi:hypothetical protein QUF55_00745 [Clostridiaceae bacterium HSG29]|nr:hypothetical protein [Clostridiaceae bacterium HSG29]
MFNATNVMIIILYMLANGLLGVFKMYKDTNEKDVNELYDNKIIRKLSKISGYLVIILLILILKIFGFYVTGTIFILGFLGQKLYGIIVHFIIVIPVNVIVYKKRRNKN